MAKKQRKRLTRQEKLAETASVVALYITTRSEEGKQIAVTAKQCMNELLEVIQKITGNQLTLENLKESLQKWADEGWATIKEGFLYITREGRNPIKEIADKFTSPEPVPA